MTKVSSTEMKVETVYFNSVPNEKVLFISGIHKESFLVCS